MEAEENLEIVKSFEIASSGVIDHPPTGSVLLPSVSVWS